MRLINALLLALLAVATLSCGYTFSQQGSSALPTETRTLFIESVENPTTQTWLGPRVRSLLRDELTRRGWTRWTDRNEADGLMKVTIHQFLRESSVKGASEDTLKYTSSITLSACIVSRDTGETIWDSGNVSWSGTYYGTSNSLKSTADEFATVHAIRRLADLLGQGY